VAVITGVADTNTDADTRAHTDTESVMAVALNCTQPALEKNMVCSMIYFMEIASLFDILQNKKYI